MNNLTDSNVQRAANILLIEDNPGDVILTRHALKKAKITNNLIVAKSGEEALTMLNQEDSYAGLDLPDLILLDLNLPGISGFDLLKSVKNSDKFKNIPIIILSSSHSEQDKTKGEKGSAQGYLTKPLNVDQLSQILQQIESVCFSIMVIQGLAKKSS